MRTNRLLVSLLPVVFLFGQRTDTIFEHTIKDAVTANVISEPVRNIGQSNHQIVVIFADQNEKTTCSYPGAAYSDPYISIDGKTREAELFTPTTAKLDKVLAAFSATERHKYVVYGYGAYPFIYARIAGMDDKNCKVNVWYSGSLYPFSNPGQNPTFTTYYSPLLSYAGTLVNIGENTIIAAMAVPPRAISIHSLTLINAAAQDIQIREKKADGKSYQEILDCLSCGAGQTVVWPVSGIPYHRTDMTSALVITTTAKTAVNYSLLVRLE